MRIVISILERFKKSRFSKNALIYTISTFCNSATPFILLPILTRYLTTSEYGMISMFTVVTGFMLPFMGMSISAATMRKFADGEEIESKEYIFNSLFIAVVASILVILICESFKAKLTKLVGLDISVFKYMYLYVVSTCIFNLTLAILQIKQYVKKYAIYQNCATLLNLLLSVCMVVFLNKGMIGRIYGLTFSKIIFAIVGLVYIFVAIGVIPKLRGKYIIDEITNFGLPMIPTEIKSTVLTCTDRIFITNLVSISETGIYSVGNQFAMPLLLLAQAFNLAYVPWLYEILKRNQYDEKRKVVKITYVYFGLAILISTLWSLLAGFSMKFIVGADYAGATQYVIWLSLGYAFTGMHMMVVNYIYYMKKIKLYSMVTIFIIVLNVALNYVLMKAYGTIGAAMATMISNLTSFILTWILSSRICKMPWTDVIFGK